MAHLDLLLLGHFQANLQRMPAPHFATHKARALLAYLAAESGYPHYRDELVGLFWPDFSQHSALTNLRSCLAEVRRAICDRGANPPLLLVDRETLQFNQKSDHWLDVSEFTRTLSKFVDPQMASCHTLSASKSQFLEINNLKSVIALYQGSFLEGFPNIGSAPFEEWILLKREQIQRMMLFGLAYLADFYEEQSNYLQAQIFARRQIEIEPWREEAHRQLMRLLFLQGERNAALTQYESCRTIFLKELGVEPSTETTRLYEQIKSGISIQTSEWISMELPRNPLFSVSPFVARQTELSKLDHVLQRAVSGRGQILFVIGEPGSGKTALLMEFARRACENYPALVAVSGRCNAYTGIGDPYLPFLEILLMLTGDLESHLSSGLISRELARRIYALLPVTVSSILGQSPDLLDRFISGKALLSRLQSIPGSLASELDIYLRRREGMDGARPTQSDLFEQYTRVLQASARRKTLLLVIDDLQWADEASISLLFHLVRRLPGHRILVLGAYRPAELAAGRNSARHPLESIVHECQRDFGDILVNLDHAEGKSFVDGFLDSEPNRLGAAFRDTLYQHTFGHPLFTVEFLRGLQERGDLFQDDAGWWVEGVSLDWNKLPPRVEAVIAERIAKLPEALQTALTIASVEGEDFSAELVAHVQGVSEEESLHNFSGALSRQHNLVIAQGLQRLGPARFSRFRFRHFLFQKYLYNRLDPVERAHLHEAVGNILESICGDQANEMVVQLAWHFEAAGLISKAIDYLQQAADRSVLLSANSEAIAFYRRALNLLEKLPDNLVRSGRELGLQMGLAVPLVASRGYSDLQVGETYDRSRYLCNQLGNKPHLVPTLLGLGSYYSIQARYAAAFAVFQQLQQIAQEVDDPSLKMVSDWQLGYYYVAVGNFSTSCPFLERALAAYNPARFDPHIFFQEPGVSILTWLARSLWALGYPDQALQRCEQALDLARERAHPFSLAFALGLAANLYHFCRLEDKTLQLAESAIEASTRFGFPLWIAFSKALHGNSLAQLGQIPAGLAEIRQGIDTVRAIGARQIQVGCLSLQAIALGQAGQLEMALQCVQEGMSLELDSQGSFNLSLLYGLKGDLLLRQGDHEAEAEDCYHQAIQCARSQQSKSWELRVTISLCRLWQRQGKQEVARQCLADIFNWFTEGFGTPDLLDARDLLGVLSAN